jgi:hypothetical protein
MCAYNVFFFNLNFWVFYECLKESKSKKSNFFFTPYSVHVEDFLPHTQYTKEIFYRTLSTRRRFLTAYSVHSKYFLPHTQ